MRLANLYSISKEDYIRLVKSGMFWELFPEATGKYEVDMEMAKNDFKKVNNV